MRNPDKLKEDTMAHLLDQHIALTARADLMKKRR